MPIDHIELWWKCSTCGTVNGGLSKKCGQRVIRNGKVSLNTNDGCGKAQDTEKWFDPIDDSHAAALTNTNHIKQATSGADWKCTYCKSTQRRLDGSCVNCGGESPS
jgi:hypothetical protein